MQYRTGSEWTKYGIWNEKEWSALLVHIFELEAAVRNGRQPERVVDSAPLLQLCGRLVAAQIAHTLEEPVEIEIHAGHTGRRVDWRAFNPIVTYCTAMYYEMTMNWYVNSGQ